MDKTYHCLVLVFMLFYTADGLECYQCGPKSDQVGFILMPGLIVFTYVHLFSGFLLPVPAVLSIQSPLSLLLSELLVHSGTV
jgi:hypothetical protein